MHYYVSTAKIVTRTHLCYVICALPDFYNILS
jgi:hypothetical protein